MITRIHSNQNTNANRKSRSIHSVVLLAGAVGTGDFETSIGRSRFDLPLSESETVADQWIEELSRIASDQILDDAPLAGRIMVDREARLPSISDRASASNININIQRDPNGYRGTGGVLHDIAKQFDDDSLLLVGNGPQVLLEPLNVVVASMLAQQADVVMTTDHTHSPIGLMLVRCGVLRDLPRIGFVDFKEQALPSISQKYRVDAIRYASPIALPIRTREDYLDALGTLHQLRGGQRNPSPFRERWQRTFSLIEPGASVDASACIHDSVVLAGARVEPGAVVVRSIVGPGVTVGRNETVIETVVSASSKAGSEQEASA